MTRRESKRYCRLTACACTFFACAILTGCGHSRNVLAQLRDAGPQIGHTLATLRVFTPSPSTAAPPANQGVIRDPFLEPAGNEIRSPNRKQQAFRRPGDGPATVESPRRDPSRGSNAPVGPTGDNLAYLDRQLQRLAATTHEADRSRERGQPEWVAGLPFADAPGFQPPAAGPAPSAWTAPAESSAVTELPIAFDRLVSRETVLSENGESHRALGGSPESDLVLPAVPEDLAPSPHPGESHLHMIVDSDQVPPRSRRWSEEFPVRGEVNPFEAAALREVAFANPSQPEPSPSIVWDERAVQGTPPAPPLELRPVAPLPPAVVEVDFSDRTSVLPEIELVMSVDAPGPPAPDIQARRGAYETDPRVRRGQPGGPAAGQDRSAPHTLQAIEFGESPEAARQPALSGLEGPLAIGLSLLLVLLAGAAFRRHLRGTHG